MGHKKVTAKQAVAVGAVLGGAYLLVRPSPHTTWDMMTVSDTGDALGLDNTPDVKSRLRMILFARLMLEPLYEDLGLFHGDSFFRSPAVNDAVGGSEDSYHMSGLAGDVKITADTVRQGQDAIMAWAWRVRDRIPIAEAIRYDDSRTHVHLALDSQHLFDPQNAGRYFATYDSGGYHYWSP